MSGFSQCWDTFDDQRPTTMTLHDHDHPPSWVMEGQIPDDDPFPTVTTTEESAQLLFEDMPCQNLPSTSSYGQSSTLTPPDSATPCSLGWPGTVAQQPTLRSPLLSSPVYHGNMQLSYPPYTFEPGHNGLGIDFGGEFPTYGFNSDTNVNPILFDAQPKVRPIADANNGAHQASPQHHNRSEPATVMGYYVGTDGDDERGDHVECSYAQLLFICLRSAKGHTLSLREIYDWFKKNSSKAKNSTSKGCENSIRHNLSMNAVCTTSYGDVHRT